MNKRLVGTKTEELACTYLKNQGLRIVAMNFRSKFGEVDIVAYDNETLVFVEVKYRKTASSGFPEEAVDYRKINNICRVCDYYRVRHKVPDNIQIRFDVVAIEGDKVRWHKSAFDYVF